MHLPPRACSLHPMAIEVGCFSVTKKHSFVEDFPAGSRAAPVPLAGGERNGLVSRGNREIALISSAMDAFPDFMKHPANRIARPIRPRPELRVTCSMEPMEAKWHSGLAVKPRPPWNMSMTTTHTWWLCRAVIRWSFAENGLR